jgi:hypothetical protein
MVNGGRPDCGLSWLSLFVLFNTLVVRDRIDPLAAHKAFLAIDEYRQTISRNQAGAEE